MGVSEPTQTWNSKTAYSHHSLNSKAPSYISSLIQPVFTVSTRPYANQHQVSPDLRQTWTYFRRDRDLSLESKPSALQPQRLEHSPTQRPPNQHYTNLKKRRLKTFLFCKSYIFCNNNNNNNNNSLINEFV